METETVLYDPLIANRVLTHRLDSFAGDNLTSICEYKKEIEIPKIFKDVVLKVYPEIQNIVSVGYKETTLYCAETFEPIKRYSVEVDLYFYDKYDMKKSKNQYDVVLNDYFKMTYSNLDFIVFYVRSFKFPLEKTNEEKFFDLFGK
jgi:hypothetical protein